MDYQKETINTFEKYADEYEGKYMGYAPYVETYKLLSELLGADASILDAACGPGNISKFLLQESPARNIHGIDLSPKMINLARRNCPTARFAVLDCRDIFSLPGPYDGIIAGFCLPYLSREEVETFIGDARKILSAGGVFYISVMEGDYHCSGPTTKNGVDWVCTYYHDAGFLAETLEVAGFEVLDLVRKPFERDGEPEAVDVFIYARAR
jgi:cyclopropane fatty-acyl-phospholipid synthase-like methyltransferase